MTFEEINTPLQRQKISQSSYSMGSAAYDSGAVTFPHCGKTNNVVSEQVRHKHRRWIETGNFDFRK